MANGKRVGIRDKYREIISSPEHQRKRVFAQTRARLIVKVGLPLALGGFLILAMLGIPPLYVAVSCVVIGVTAGWAIGTQIAAKKARDLPLS